MGRVYRRIQQRGCLVGGVGLPGSGVQKCINTPLAAEHFDWQPTVATVTEKLSERGWTNRKKANRAKGQHKYTTFAVKLRWSKISNTPKLTHIFNLFSINSALVLLLGCTGLVDSIVLLCLLHIAVRFVGMGDKFPPVAWQQPAIEKHKKNPEL